jgi:ubiquinol-cytochrome c reductase cytochrome b/c1 subunit
MSFWGATVITNLFSAFPIIGNHIVTWPWGGFSVDDPTLRRYFALHYLLPFVILGMVFLHLAAVHVRGSSNPTGIDTLGPQDMLPFHPYFTIKDFLASCVLLIVFSVVVFFLPNVLGHPDNYIPANPLVTPAHIVPEWYFLPFYAMLRAIPNKLGGVIAMFGSILLLFFLPWLDTKVRSVRYRPVYKWFFWLLIVCVFVLGYVGSQPPEGIFIPIGQVATAYYFGHFLIVLPLLGRIERPRPLPVHLGEPVLPVTP